MPKVAVVRRMSEKEKPILPKRRLGALDVTLIGMGAAIYAVCLTTTAYVMLFPGIESLRWANFIPAFLGLFFGPFIGGLAAGLGNVIGDLAGGILTAGSYAGFTLNYIGAYVVAKYCKSIEKKDSWKWAVIGIAAYVLALWPWLGPWINFLGMVPMPLWHTLNITLFSWASYAPIVLIVLFGNIFRDRILRANLYWRQRLQVKNTGPWPLIFVVVGSVMYTLIETYDPIAFQGTLLGGTYGIYMTIAWLWLVYDSLKMEGRI